MIRGNVMSLNPSLGFRVQAIGCRVQIHSLLKGFGLSGRYLCKGLGRLGISY